ncbi:MAG: class I SAM-dependent methyltransferase [Isosphaeraceae bacterium]
MSFYSHSVGRSTSVPREGDASLLAGHEAEAWVLNTNAGLRLLAEVTKVSTPRPADIDRMRGLAVPEAVAAAIRLASCRARARTKFTRAECLWLDPVGLEQATSEVVARHKARRFQAGSLVVDLCAGIGGDTMAFADRGPVLAVDLDHGMCRRLAWNAAAYEVGDRVLPCQCRAEGFSIPGKAWVHIDPDRRVKHHVRARSVSDYAPGLAFLQRLSREGRAGAIKLGPASDFSSHFAGPGFEVELISLHGECKEATVWFGAPVRCSRRATVLPEDVTWTDRDGGDQKADRAPIGPISEFLYDPDPALLRSGLLDSFALAHGLYRIAADVDYLTSEKLLVTPFLAAFEVEDVHRLDLKQLRRLVVEQDLGPLEIKVRGLDIAPETLRQQLRARGARPATLILAGGAGPARAILAQRQGTRA